MPITFSYASILQAIGQLLDQTSVKSFAIQEEKDGLFVEGFDSEGQLQVQIRYDIASLYQLMMQSDDAKAKRDTATSGVLHRFLADHHQAIPSFQ
jgi:hypothetical protein